MKKHIIILLIMILLIFPSIVYGHVDDKINMIEMNVKIEQNGNAKITEKWFVNSVERFSYFKFYQDLNSIDIENFTVTDEENNQYENLGKWDISMSNENKKNKYGINDTEEGIELCWGVDGNGFHVYTLNYEIKDFTKRYKQGNTIKFNFIEERNESSTIRYRNKN